MIERLRPWLRRLYPTAWRLRYGEEFDALLAECLHSPLDVVDILLGAADAHLLLLSGESLTWRIMNMLNKIRTAILIVFAAFIAFVVAGFALVGLADDSPMIALTQKTASLTAAWTIIQAGSAIALLAVVVGGLPLAILVLRGALTRPHKGLGLLLVPVISFLVLVVYVFVLWLEGTGRIQIAGVEQVVQPGPFPAGNRLLMMGLMLVFILGAIASTAAVWKVISRTDEQEETFKAFRRSFTVQIYQFAYWPAVVAAVIMLVMLVATLAWGWLSFAALPGVLGGNYGPWGMSTLAWFAGILVVMAVATAAAFWGIKRAR